MALPKRRLGTIHTSFNPAAVQRQIQALCDELLTLATAKGQPTPKPRVSTPTTTRTFPDEAKGADGASLRSTGALAAPILQSNARI